MSWDCDAPSEHVAPVLFPNISGEIVPVDIGTRQSTIKEATSYIHIRLCARYNVSLGHKVHTLHFEPPCKGKVLIIQAFPGNSTLPIGEGGVMASDGK